MEYRKEKTFIVAYDDNNTMRGKWNIQTNRYIGVRGMPIKSIPQAFKSDAPEMPTYIRDALCLIREYAYLGFSTALGNRLEQLLSLQLRVGNDPSTRQFIVEDTTPLTKDVVNYLRDHCEGCYSAVNIRSYKFFKEHQEFLRRCEDHAPWAMEVLQLHVIENIPAKFVKDMIIYGIHEKVFYEYSAYQFGVLLKTWADIIKDLNDTLEAKRNILTNYNILEYIYEQYKQEHYDDQIRKHNDLQWLYYENDEYIVRPLLSRAEFHAEAEAQHNCVERMYMERVYDGKTHVVTVRKKNNPNRPYITCEVLNNGTIWQYLLRYNERPRGQADLRFREEYSDHIETSLSSQK